MADGDYERRDSRIGELRRLQRIIDEAKAKKDLAAEVFSRKEDGRLDLPGKEMV